MTNVSGLKCQLSKVNLGQVKAGEYGCFADTNATLTPTPLPTTTPAPNPVSCTGLSKYCSSTNSCESVFYPCPESQNPTPTPRQKQLISIVIKNLSQDIEIYPQNPLGVDLNLIQNTAYIMEITYTDENGTQQTASRSLIFQRPSPSPFQTITPAPTILATPSPVETTPAPTNPSATEPPTQDCGSFLQKYCPNTNECISVFYNCP